MSTTPSPILVVAVPHVPGVGSYEVREGERTLFAGTFAECNQYQGEQLAARSIMLATADRERLEEEAHRLGAEAGRAAASWYFDGNTTREQYGRVVTGLADGDPAIYDTFPTSGLSGEWADDPTPGDVLRSLGVDEHDEANDDLLRMYEDGFGVAVADEIERLAREGYQAAEEAERTTQDVARRMARRFTQRTREDGTKYTTLTDEADEWMRDVVREAHGDMLPDDWRYEAIASAVEFIAEEDDADDRQDEWADGYVDVYSSALIEWLGSHGARAGYVQEARDDFGDAGEDVWEEIRRGQFYEAREVIGLVLGALEEAQDAS